MTELGFVWARKRGGFLAASRPRNQGDNMLTAGDEKRSARNIKKRNPRDEEAFLLSLPAVARRMDVSESTIRRRIAEGTMKAVRFGGRRFVKKTEFDRVMSAL
jgi:excisionase family DNA binding protein